jgi:hypothetical protein
MRIMPTSASFIKSFTRLLALTLLGSGLRLLAAQATPAVPAESAQQLAADMVYNELHDRAADSLWEYRSERISGAQHLVREQVETAEGPIFRVIEDHGNPLGPAERRREDQRLRDLVERPGAMNRVRQDHEQDEARMTKIMQMLPSAFLFEYDGPAEGDRVQIRFRPNPDFVPAGYEARVVHALGGTILVNQRLKRMIDMKGRLVEQVDFGYGILGHVEKDGTFEIHREQVSDAHWKTDLVDVHIQGKVLLFKNVTKDQRESRSDFRPVSHEIGLAAAKELLDNAGSLRNEASLSRGGR